MADWYVKAGDSERGPVSSAQLKELARNGQIAPTSGVRRSDRDGWIKAGSIKGLFDGRASTPSRLSEAEIRRRLKLYAESIQQDDVQDFGANVALKKATTMPLYSVRLTTLYETRKVVSRQRPQTGSEPRSTVEIGDVDAWSLDLQQPTKFEKQKFEHEVPGTARVVECRKCDGGTVTCPICKGQTVFPCRMCQGAGAATCQSCGGQGSVEDVRYVRSQRHCKGMLILGQICKGGYTGSGEVCSKCNGTGIEIINAPESFLAPCPDCDSTGQRACQGCDGHGTIECMECDMTGVTTCQTCDGKGQAVEYGVICQNQEVEVDEGPFNPKGISFDILKGLQGSDFQLHHEQEGYFQSAKDADSSLSEFATAIEEQLQRSTSRTSEARRIVRHKLTVLQAFVTHVRYIFEGVEYEAWLPGNGDCVIAPKSPMTIQIDRLVGEALRMWNEGKRHAAALTLRRALEVAMSNDECRQAFVRHADSIPAQLAQKAPTARPIWEPIVIWGAWPAGFFLGGALFEITGIIDIFAIANLGGLVVSVWSWVKRTKPLPLDNKKPSQKPSGQRKSKDSSRKKSKGGPSRGISVKKKGGGS